PVRLFHLDRLEAEPLAWPRLADTPDVTRADRRRLRVAAGRLPVDQEHDRLPVAGDLDRPQRDPVGDDVVAARVLDPRPAQARAHPIRLRQPLVAPAEERSEAFVCEAVGLRAEHGTHGRLAGVVRDVPSSDPSRVDGARGQYRELVALPERAALQPADP